MLAVLILLGFLMTIWHKPRRDTTEQNGSPQVHKMPKHARKAVSRKSRQASRRRLAS